MYKNYPVVVLMLYCEQKNSNEEVLELIKRIRIILKKRKDCFTKNHLLTHLIINNPYDCSNTTFDVVPNSDECVNLIHYCSGYSLVKILSKAFAEHLKLVSSILGDETNVFSMPTEIILIQNEGEVDRNIDKKFKDIKHLARLNRFFFSTNKTASNLGDYDQLDRYLCDFLEKLSQDIAEKIKGLDSSIEMPYQKNLYLY